MSDPTNITALREAQADDAFKAFAEAARRAQTTLNPADAKIAGQAWGVFLDCFITREQRDALRMRDPSGGVIHGRFPGPSHSGDAA